LRGRPVGFGGRLLGPGEPKYLNSPETEIFHKGKQLYNLHQAKMAIRKEETVILVEGYFDVLRLVLAGVEHVVAPLGTALTADQAILLKRFVKDATLLYDSDRAGLQATFRTGDELLRHGFRVRVATLPPGEDPDTIVRQGGVEALQPVLGDAIDLFERKIQLLERAGWFEGFDRRRDAVDRLLPTIRAAADPITRELYLSLAAQRSGVSKDVLQDELSQVAPPARASADGGANQGSHPPTSRSSRPNERTRSNPETKLLAALISAPEWVSKAREEIPPALLEITRFRELYEALIRREAPSGQMPDGLSPEAAAVWSFLKETAHDRSSGDAAAIYDRASQILRGRPLYREMHAISDPGDKQRRRSALRAQLPAADAWYEYQKAARRESRKTQRSRGT
jgi:DNA primase